MTRYRLVAVLAVGVLALAGCSSSDDGDAGGGSGADTTQAGGDVAADAPLTRSDGDAFAAELTARTPGQSEDYINCVAGEVKAAADAGDFSPQEVRSWTAGDQIDTPLQEFITSIDVVAGCSGADTTATTAAG